MSTKCGLASSEPMDDIMSKDEREEVRERCEAAGEGPWGYTDDGRILAEPQAKHSFTVASGLKLKTHSKFIAHARADLPRALDTIDAMEAQIDAFKRGRIANWHAEQVTAEMLRAYLEASERWSVRSNDGGHSWWGYSEGGFRAYVRSGRIRATISNVAIGEGRGELAVWCDIVGGEGG